MRVAVGTDIVSVRRLEHAIGTLGGEFLDRVFTAAEQSACAGDANRLAARWAAKESVLKALGIGVEAVALHEIEVVSEPSGQPTVQLTGVARRAAAAAGWVQWSVSLSHDAGIATAVVVAMTE